MKPSCFREWFDFHLAMTYLYLSEWIMPFSWRFAGFFIKMADKLYDKWNPTDDNYRDF